MTYGYILTTFNGGELLVNRGITSRYPGDQNRWLSYCLIAQRVPTLGTSEGFTLQALGRIKLTRRMFRESFNDFLGGPWILSLNQPSWKLSPNFGPNFAKLET